mmetsp:Transcript_31633/g.58126  ORF Transcript_31633/g.58126 Transcript_31633/m.58126 type:complete len:254 (-) Transcript_31633:9-770(-)
MASADLLAAGLLPRGVLLQRQAHGSPQAARRSQNIGARAVPPRALAARFTFARGAAAAGVAFFVRGAKRRVCPQAVCVRLAQSQDQPPATEEPPATSDPEPPDEEPPGTSMTSEVVDAELIGTTEESRRSRETAFDDLPMAVTGIRKPQTTEPITVEQVAATQELPRAVTGSGRPRRAKGRGFGKKAGPVEAETVTVEEAPGAATVKQESSYHPPAAANVVAEIDERHLQVVDFVLQQTNEYLKQRREKDDAW